MKPVYERSVNYLGRLGRAALLVCCAGLGGLTLSGSAGAQTTAPFVLNNFTPNPGVMPGGGWKWTPGSNFGDPPPTRTFSPGPGGAIVEDGLQIATKAGQLPVRVRQAVTIADAAAAVGRCLSRSVVCAAALAAAAILYDRYRTKQAPQLPGLVADPGQPQVQGSQYRCESSQALGVYFYDSSAIGACTKAASALDRTVVGGGYRRVITNTGVVCDARSCVYDETTLVYNSSSGAFVEKQGPYKRGANFTTVSALQCPAVVDFYDPRYSVPGGPPGPDGKCPTGVYSQRVTPEEAAQKVVAFPPSDATLSDALKQAVSQGESVPSTVSTSGPATQVGQPTTTTTTTPTGTATTTATPTYTYHYDGDTITYDTTVSTTVVNNDGSQSTTTTTTTGPSADKESKDPCDLHPERVGCMGLGSPPDDQVKKTQKDVSWAAEDPGLPAACPADFTVQTSHGTATFTYKPACDTAAKMAPLVIAVGAFVALMMVGATLRNA